MGVLATAYGESLNAVFKPPRASGSILQLLQTYVEYNVQLYIEVHAECDRHNAHVALGTHHFMTESAYRKHLIHQMNAKCCKVSEREVGKVYVVQVAALNREHKLKMAGILSASDSMFSGSVTEHRQDPHCSSYTRSMADVPCLSLQETLEKMSHVGDEHSVMSQMDSSVRAIANHGQLAQFIVNLDEKTCTCGEWQNVGLPCVHAVAVMTARQAEKPDDDLFNPFSREFVEKWCHPRYWCSTNALLFKGVANQYTSPRLADLEEHKTCTAPLHRCSEAYNVQCKLDRGEEVSVDELCSALEKMGVDPPRGDGAGNASPADRKQMMVRVLKQTLERDYVRARRPKVCRWLTKGLDAGAYQQKTTALSRCDFLAPTQCSLCQGIFHNRLHCAGDPNSVAYLDSLRQLNRRAAKFNVVYAAGALPRDTNGHEFFPTDAQLHCFQMTGRLLAAWKHQESGVQAGQESVPAHVWAQELASMTSGRNGAAVRSSMPDGFMDLMGAAARMPPVEAPQCPQPCMGAASQRMGEWSTDAGTTAGRNRLTIGNSAHDPLRQEGPPAGGSDAALGETFTTRGAARRDNIDVPQQIWLVAQPYEKKPPHVSELPALMPAVHAGQKFQQKRRVTARSSEQPGPYTPQGLFKKLVDLMHSSSDPAVRDFLKCPAGYRVEYGEGKDINYFAHTAKQLSTRHIFGFYHDEPMYWNEVQRDLPPDIHETKAGFDLRLRTLDDMAINAGMLPGFRLRQLIFGEKPLNGPSRVYVSADTPVRGSQASASSAPTTGRGRGRGKGGGGHGGGRGRAARSHGRGVTSADGSSASGSGATSPSASLYTRPAGGVLFQLPAFLPPTSMPQPRHPTHVHGNWLHCPLVFNQNGSMHAPPATWTPPIAGGMQRPDASSNAAQIAQMWQQRVLSQVPLAQPVPPQHDSPNVERGDGPT